MLRVWVAQIPPAGATVLLGPDEERHLRVRRPDPGEILEIIDGQGHLARGQLAISGKHLQITVDEHIQTQRENAGLITAYLALPQALDSLESVLPGLVQLGVHRIQILQTQWSGPKRLYEKFERRFENLACQALKQSGRLVAPTLLGFKAIEQVLTQGLTGQHWLLHPGGQGHLPRMRPPELGFWVGPEAGFHSDEVALAQQMGVAIVDCGPRILRMETAVIGVAFQIAMTPLSGALT
ncbi:MAG: RsmE family RNA methyltransferase [Acidobacteria bacterium]|nr:RsmE family RNA methyltransferase [Acidobacteriota bacterium]